MKKNKTIYWIFTILFGGLMALTAIPDVMNSEEAVKFMAQLGYPKYFVPFIGIAKVLGVIAIVIPGFPRIKEWAYAGLFFDLIGAMFSITVTTAFVGSLPLLVPVGLGIGSYVYYHKLNTQNK